MTPRRRPENGLSLFLEGYANALDGWPVARRTRYKNLNKTCIFGSNHYFIYQLGIRRVHTLRVFFWYRGLIVGKMGGLAMIRVQSTFGTSPRVNRRKGGFLDMRLRAGTGTLAWVSKVFFLCLPASQPSGQPLDLYLAASQRASVYSYIPERLAITFCPVEDVYIS